MDNGKTKITESLEKSGAHALPISDEQAARMDRTQIPLRPQTAKKTPSEDGTVRMLRGFYLGNPEIPAPDDPVDGRYLPAFLSLYRDGAPLRHDYPLFLANIDAKPASGASWLAQEHGGVFPLPGLFDDLVGDFVKKSGSLLRENLVRLENHIVEVFADDKGAHGHGEPPGKPPGKPIWEPREADTVLNRAIPALLDALHLADKQRGQLETELTRLRENMPAGRFLPFSRHAPLYLLAHAAKRRFRSQRAKTLMEIEHLAGGLNALLDMEKNKSIEAIEPKMLLDGLGPGGERFLDPLALSDLMDHRHGSRIMSPARRGRIRETLETLENEREKGIGPARIILVRAATASAISGLEGNPLPQDPDRDWESRESSNPFHTATVIFDEEIDGLIRLARAMRIATIELENRYDTQIHDAWFSNFDWRALSEHESKLAPVVVVTDSASNAARNQLVELSRLLHANRPIQAVLETQPSADPGKMEANVRGAGHRTELGYLGIGHRQAVVAQSSATRPRHLLAGFEMALETRRPALHLLAGGYSGDTPQPLPLRPWLVESAAVESRAHPLFHYDPTFGGKWSIPLSLAENPQPEIDWPGRPFEYRTEDGAVTEITMTFGFADYALLDLHWWPHFYPAPDTLDTKAMIHLDDYLAQEPGQRGNRLPFLWTVHEDTRTRGMRLRRLIVSSTLVEACLDRREFWRTLQAMAGVRNRHVEAAVTEAVAGAREKFEAKRSGLVTEHRTALEKTRKEAGADALRRLTDTLLSMDLTGKPGPSGIDEPEMDAPPAAAGRLADKQLADNGGEPDLGISAEPWIDTPLCTSCNECTEINPGLFVYDDNKQAEIGDLAAGTQEDWIKAGELCPAQCIHP